MGVRQLWKTIQHETSRCELTMLVMESYEQNGSRRYRLGVDASIWYYLCNSGKQRVWGENSALGTFFNKLTRLAKLPVDVVFIFDGDQKPAIKRGVQVRHRNNPMYNGMIAFIQAFGFQHHMAPAEAEAELASLYQAGCIDAILTDDSDVLLFGGGTVIRNWNIKNDREFVSVRRKQPNSLSRECLILFGLLVGGDYDDQKGLHGCGPDMALQLVSEPFADELCNAARTLSRSGLTTYLISWRQSLRDFIRSNPHGTLNHQHRKIADSIPTSFPDPDVIYLYLKPLVSLATEVDLTCRLPDVASITRECELHFSWATSRCILSHFESGILPMILMRVLTDIASLARPRFDSLPPSFTIAHNLFPASMFTIGTKRQKHQVSHHEITGSVTHLRQSILSALRGFRLSTSSLPLVMNEISPSQPFKTWVPTLILQNLLVMSQHVPHSPGLDISVMSIRTAFTLADEIDMPTLSWLTQTYLAPRAQSTEAILDVVEELCMAISDGFRQNPTSLGLIRRYLHLARSLPESIPRNLTLGPVVNALRSYLADLYQNGDILLSEMSGLLQFASSTSTPLVQSSDNIPPEPSIQGSSGHDLTRFDTFCTSKGIPEGQLLQMGD